MDYKIFDDDFFLYANRKIIKSSLYTFLFYAYAADILTRYVRMTGLVVDARDIITLIYSDESDLNAADDILNENTAHNSR